MQLKTYLTILRRRKWVIAIITLLATGLAAFGTLRATPVYESTATLYIATTVDGDYRSGQTTYADRLKRTYTILATSDIFLDELAQELNLPGRPEVNVVNVANSELLEVVVEDTDPERASTVANAVAASIVDESASTLQGQANPVILRQAAIPPRNPAGPNNRLNIALGLVAGLIGGLGLALLLENLDTTIHSVEQVRAATNLMVLGEIPRVRGRLDISRSGFESKLEGEAFRRLHSNLIGLRSQRHLQSFMVSSALPSEGKSSVAAGMGLVMAMSGKSVVVVDSDLRHPTMHRIFDLKNSVGLYDVLADDMPIDDVIQTVDFMPRLQVLTSGRSESHPFELLASDEMGRLLKELQTRYDAIVIDSPPITTVPDAAILAPQVDGVLLVVGQGRGNLEAIQSAEQQLAIARTEPIGVVVNRTRGSKTRGHAYHDVFSG